MFTFQIPSKIEFGAGASEKCAQTLKDFKAKKVLCIYDKGIKQAGVVDKIAVQLKNAAIEVVHYDQVLPNPPDTSVAEAAAYAKEEDVDALVAIGGGSSIDTAKAVNTLVANGGTIHQYVGPQVLHGETFPLIAIPTTAGTGSETTDVTIITDTGSHKKMIIRGAHCSTDVSLVDPELTLGLPPHITAATGMDALTHALEAYISNGASPATDINALKAIHLITQSLEEAVHNGSSLEARSNMLLGSLFAGFAFNSAGLGLVHAIAHPISAHAGVAHGVANATVLPYVMRFNAGSDHMKQRSTDIAGAMALPVEGLKPEEAANLVVEQLKTLCEKVNIPNLEEAGVGKDQLSIIAEDALKENSMKFTPRTAGKDDVIAILEIAFKGNVQHA